MRLIEIFKEADIPKPCVERYLREIQPPIDAAKLEVLRKVVGADVLSVPIDDGVGGVLEIQYKKRAGGTLSIAEDSTGETWTIPAVQGARSRSSYRVSTGVEWEQLLADDALSCAQVMGALVRRIVMPPTFSITNISYAASESINLRYARVRSALNMQWSDEEKKYVRDIVK